MKIYIASKVKHAEKWLKASEQLNGDEFNSTWIFEAGPGQTTSTKEFCERMLWECKTCDLLIVYCEEGEHLKGAFIEMGAAMGAGKPIYLVGPVLKPESVFMGYYAIYPAASLHHAIELERKKQRGAEVKQKAQYLERSCPECTNDSFKVLETIKAPKGTFAGHYRVECTVCGFIEAAISKSPYTERQGKHKRGKVEKRPGAE